MTTWEYQTLKVAPFGRGFRKGNGTDDLNALGADGWELVHISPEGVAFLKRPRMTGA